MALKHLPYEPFDQSVTQKSDSRFTSSIDFPSFRFLFTFLVQYRGFHFHKIPSQHHPRLTLSRSPFIHLLSSCFMQEIRAWRTTRQAPCWGGGWSEARAIPVFLMLITSFSFHLSFVSPLPARTCGRKVGRKDQLGAFNDFVTAYMPISN